MLFTQEAMERAMNDVNVNNMSINESARIHGIPRKTLADCSNGWWLPNKVGNPTIADKSIIDYVHFYDYVQIKGFAWVTVLKVNGQGNVLWKVLMRRDGDNFKIGINMKLL